MSEYVTVEGELLGRMVHCGKVVEETSPITHGNYRIEKLPIGDSFLFSPHNSRNYSFVVETAHMKVARTLGRMRFVHLEELPSGYLSGLVDRVLGGASIDEELESLVSHKT